MRQVVSLYIKQGHQTYPSKRQIHLEILQVSSLIHTELKTTNHFRLSGVQTTKRALASHVVTSVETLAIWASIVGIVTSGMRSESFLAKKLALDVQDASKITQMKVVIPQRKVLPLSLRFMVILRRIMRYLSDLLGCPCDISLSQTVDGRRDSTDFHHLCFHLL